MGRAASRTLWGARTARFPAGRVAFKQADRKAKFLLRHVISAAAIARPTLEPLMERFGFFITHVRVVVKPVADELQVLKRARV